MTKFEKPGSQGGRLPRLGEGGRHEGAGRRRHRLRPDRAGLRRLLLRRLHLRPARRLRARPHRHPGRTTSTTTARRARRALYLAHQAVEGGLADCALALGFEKMEKGSLGMKYTDRTHADRQAHAAHDRAARAGAARRPRRRCSATPGASTWSATAPRPSTSPRSARRTTSTRSTTRTRSSRHEYTLEDIKDAPMIHDPLTKLQCSPTCDGAGAALVASERFVEEHGLWDQAVEIAGQAMATDLRSTFDEKRCIKLVGSDMTRKAARAGVRRGGPGHRGRPRHRAARLLLRQRADHLRGARAVRRGRGRTSSSRTSDHLRRPAGS